MDRRQFNGVSIAMLGGWIGCTAGPAQALTLADLSEADASKGLRTVLEKGALSAILLLGAKDGFLGNEQVRIPLPGYLNGAAGLLRTLGQGAQVDELLTAMNRGAEAAVPMAKNLLLGAIKNMTPGDAKGILGGGDTAVSAFFEQKTRAPLGVSFQPLVRKATGKVGLADKYNQLAGKALELGLVKKEDANIEQYVTTKALDGLYFMIAQEEKKMRQNPAGYGSALLTKIFGNL